MEFENKSEEEYNEVYFIGLFLQHMQREKKINIAIDGLSGCGKSTLAKALAEALNYVYIDTGAMYRALTWYFINKVVEQKKKRDKHGHHSLKD